MCMENVFPATVLTAEGRSMTGTHQAVGMLQNRISLVFLPRSHRAVRSRVTHSVVLAFKVIGRINQVINVLSLQDGRPLGYFGGLVLREFPRLPYFDALRQCLLLDAGQVIVHLCHPDDIAIRETHEIKVRRAVIVDEERGIDALLIPYRLLHLLTERSLRCICRCHADMLFGGVEQIKLLLRLDVVDFRRPESPRAVGVGSRQCLAFTRPVSQIIGREAGKALSFYRTSGAVSIILAFVKHYVRVGNRQIV